MTLSKRAKIIFELKKKFFFENLKHNFSKLEMVKYHLFELFQIIECSLKKNLTFYSFCG